MAPVSLSEPLVTDECAGKLTPGAPTISPRLSHACKAGAVAGLLLVAVGVVATSRGLSAPRFSQSALRTAIPIPAESLIENCPDNTGGTCRGFACSADRGPTICTNGLCLCAPGLCATAEGTCVPPSRSSEDDTCDQDTQMSCFSDAPTGCATSGPSRCVNDRCVCTQGSCSRRSAPGVCVPQTCHTDTQSTCRILGCDAWRGANCVNSRCVCPAGLCVDANGACASRDGCNQHTGTSCPLGYCAYARGPTDCPNHECTCKPGFCSFGGICELDGWRQNATITAEVWQVSASHPAFPGAHGNVRSGLAVSGGGGRSLSITLGVFRALSHLGLMAEVDAISAVSGGAWASGIYMFANGSTDELLGRLTTPSELSMDVLGRTPPRLGAAMTKTIGEFTRSVAATPLGQSGRVFWESYVATNILEPVGLDIRTAFLAGSTEQRDRILAANPHLRSHDFLIPQPDRPPVLIIGGVLLSPEGWETSGGEAVSLQMSPDYTGSPFHPNNSAVVYNSPGRFRASSDIHIGGGLVETFAFGTYSPHQLGSTRETSMPAEPFTLVKALAISSAAYGAIAARHFGLQSADPSALYWPVTEHREHRAREYNLGDGGNNEDAGLLPLLQRGARTVIWLCNTDKGITTDTDLCDERLYHPADFSPAGLITDQITDKFGYGSNGMASFLANNHVFPKEDLGDVMCGLQRLRNAGRPAVFHKSHRVLPNTWWGIQGGYDVEIVYIYNEHVADFVQSLPQDTQHALSQSLTGGFHGYPFMMGVMQNLLPPQPTAYTNAQVNLLSAQSEYAVMQNQATIREALARSHGI